MVEKVELTQTLVDGEHLVFHGDEHVATIRRGVQFTDWFVCPHPRQIRGGFPTLPFSSFDAAEHYAYAIGHESVTKPRRK